MGIIIENNGHKIDAKIDSNFIFFHEIHPGSNFSLSEYHIFDFSMQMSHACLLIHFRLFGTAFPVHNTFLSFL